jgi:hypothetical protein
MSVVRRTNRAATGSASVTVQGASMGLASFTAGARTGVTSCEHTAWEADTSVRCQIGYGAAGSRRLISTVGIRQGTVTRSLSFDIIMVSLAGMANRAATGSASMTLHGGGLGLVSFTVSWKVGQSVCERSTWSSDTSVRCQVAHGVAGSRTVSMSVGHRAGSFSQGYSTETGGLSVARRANRGATGSTSITLHGSSVGLASYTVSLRVGRTMCERSSWENRDAHVVCDGRPDWLRANDVGGGYIFAMPVRAWFERQRADINDEWVARGQPLARIQHGG